MGAAAVALLLRKLCLIQSPSGLFTVTISFNRLKLFCCLSVSQLAPWCWKYTTRNNNAGKPEHSQYQSISLLFVWALHWSVCDTNLVVGCLLWPAHSSMAIYVTLIAFYCAVDILFYSIVIAIKAGCIFFLQFNNALTCHLCIDLYWSDVDQDGERERSLCCINVCM